MNRKLEANEHETTTMTHRIIKWLITTKRMVCMAWTVGEKPILIMNSVHVVSDYVDAFWPHPIDWIMETTMASER